MTATFPSTPGSSSAQLLPQIGLHTAVVTSQGDFENDPLTNRLPPRSESVCLLDFAQADGTTTAVSDWDAEEWAKNRAAAQQYLDSRFGRHASKQDLRNILFARRDDRHTLAHRSDLFRRAELYIYVAYDLHQRIHHLSRWHMQSQSVNAGLGDPFWNPRAMAQLISHVGDDFPALPPSVAKTLWNHILNEGTMDRMLDDQAAASTSLLCCVSQRRNIARQIALLKPVLDKCNEKLTCSVQDRQAGQAHIDDWARGTRYLNLDR